MGKKPFSTQLPEAQLKELRAAVVQLAGPPEYISLGELVRRGVGRELHHLRLMHNEGRPFVTDREHTPKTGPRPKA